MTRLIPLVATAVLALSASPALASGKGGGGGGSTPPAPTVDPCEGYWNEPGLVNRTNGGCVIVSHSDAGVNRLDRVILLPGWSYVVESNGEGTKSRVELSFSNATTGQTASIRVENGKTDIR
jgi:hypothetical protein